MHNFKWVKIELVKFVFCLIDKILWHCVEDYFKLFIYFADINECETEGICDGDEYCINKNGSHTCSSEYTTFCRA